MSEYSQMEPSESLAYRNALREKAYKSIKITDEEKLWLYTNPVYSRRYGPAYFQKDIITLKPNKKYLVEVTCLHFEKDSPIVPTLSITMKSRGSLTLDADFHQSDLLQLLRPSRKVSFRMDKEHAARVVFKSNSGLLGITYQCWIPKPAGMSRWWESSLLDSLAFTKEIISENKVKYGCCSGAYAMQGQEPEEDTFGKFVFTVEWTEISLK